MKESRRERTNWGLLVCRGLEESSQIGCVVGFASTEFENKIKCFAVVYVIIDFSAC